MKSILLSFSLIPFIAHFSCAGSNFAGGSSGTQKPKKELPNESRDLNSDTGGPNTVSIDDMGKIEDCANGTMVQDPNAVFTFGNGEAKQFINSLGNITPIPIAAFNTGNVHGDKASTDAVCRLKGYVASESFTTGKYSSCGDNTHAYWNDAVKNFDIRSACDNNITAKTIMCRGLLKDPCAQDKSWVFQQQGQPNQGLQGVGGGQINQFPNQNQNGQFGPQN